MLTAAPLFLLAVIYAQFIEPAALRVTERTFIHQTITPELDGLKIVFLADIHSKDKHLPRLAKVIDKVNDLKPDLILLGGDFVNGNGKCTPPDKLLKKLNNLSAPLGIYAVSGNHDYRYGIEKFRQAFTSEKIKLLNDQRLELRTDNGGKFNLIGLDYQLNPHRRMDQKRLQKLFYGTNFNLAITHTPADWEFLPASATLTLAGHTHGGQIHIPLMGSLINPQGHGRSLSYGEKHSGNKTLFITAGLSSAYTPARFCMKPEILLITLQSPDKKRY